jgi:hypothetical protein
MLPLDEKVRSRKGLRSRLFSYATGIVIESLAVVAISLLVTGLMLIVRALV